jgi:protein-L-isoaspartate(D-aspartate) O-methyltransferase
VHLLEDLTTNRRLRQLTRVSVLLLTTMAPICTSDLFTTERECMVREQIESRGIRNADVLRAIRATPRHLFVPRAFQADAYDDHPLPIGYGATISQPYIVALMTELLDPIKQQRVLEIGTGSGYQAAVLAQLVSQVYTVEIVPELAESARKTLSALGYSNVFVRQGDGYEGWLAHAPFDRILVTAAPSEVPKALIEQLAIGGRLVAPIGSSWVQELIIVDKKPDGTVHRASGPSVMFLPMRPSRN